MKNLLTAAIVLLAFVLMSVKYGEVQQTPKQVRFGHIDMTDILKDMPQLKQARAKMDAERKSAEKAIQDKQMQMQNKYVAAAQKAQAGQLTQVEQKQVEQELSQMEQALAKQQQELTENFIKKEQALLEPIQKRIDKAIDDVAKEKGYRFIFDSSKGGFVLYGRDSDNVMKYVKPKLGM
ncbi:MAG: OmpH family outer membrane protein [Saprospiraceae bacterium]